MIGDFRVTSLPPNLPKGSPVEITYEYDASGRISATAKELVGYNVASAEIVRDYGMDEKSVDDAFQALQKEYAVE